MEENIITIHLDGGLVSKVDGLRKKQKFEVLDWDTEATFTWEEARKYIMWIAFRADKSERLQSLQDILLRIDP